MPADDKPSEQSMDRRRFFRFGLGELLRPLGSALAPLERAAHHVGALEEMVSAASSASTPRRLPLDIWLRPPGALPEQQFRETCSRCGDCVRACPASAIVIDSTGAKGNG